MHASTELRNPPPIRLCGLHTRCTLLRCRAPLRERLSSQPARRARTLSFTSSQGSAAVGCSSRFAFRRANSCFCQSWMGTVSGSDARSSHKSSTSWSFSDGLRSKIDVGVIWVSASDCLRLGWGGSTKEGACNSACVQRGVRGRGRDLELGCLGRWRGTRWRPDNDVLRIRDELEAVGAPCGSRAGPRADGAVILSEGAARCIR